MWYLFADALADLAKRAFQRRVWSDLYQRPNLQAFQLKELGDGLGENARGTRGWRASKDESASAILFGVTDDVQGTGAYRCCFSRSLRVSKCFMPPSSRP